MPAPPLLDTNILLRHLRQDHADHSARATAYLAQVERGEIEVRVTETVVFETVFTLEKVYRQERADIRGTLLPLLELPGVLLPHVDRLDRVFDLYVDTNLSFADAYHAVLALESEPAEIVSFDQGFDRVAGLRRIEP